MVGLNIEHHHSLANFDSSSYILHLGHGSVGTLLPPAYPITHLFSTTPIAQ